MQIDNFSYNKQKEIRNEMKRFANMVKNERKKDKENFTKSLKKANEVTNISL